MSEGCWVPVGPGLKGPQGDPGAAGQPGAAGGPAAASTMPIMAGTVPYLVDFMGVHVGNGWMIVDWAYPELWALLYDTPLASAPRVFATACGIWQSGPGQGGGGQPFGRSRLMILDNNRNGFMFVVTPPSGISFAIFAT